MQYAYFDSAVAAPSPVLGWYDTELSAAPLPPSADLLVLTSAQWDERMSATWAVSAGSLVAYTSPPPLPATLAQQADALLARGGGGLTITSTGTPAINGTYPIDDATFGDMAEEAQYIAAFGAFTEGLSALPWLTAAGPVSIPTTATFLSLVRAIGDYRAALKRIASGTSAATSLPADAVTIS